MPVIAAVRQLFAEKDQPWTLDEIAARLEIIDPQMNYRRVYRAWQTLLRVEDAALVAAVQPLPSKQRPARFGPTATRLIARAALPRRTKNRIVEMARTGTTPPMPPPRAKK